MVPLKNKIRYGYTCLTQIIAFCLRSSSSFAPKLGQV